MKKAVLFASVIVFGVAGCAKRPDAIVPVDIPMAAYENLDCQQIASEIIQENQVLASLSKTQNDAATGDAVGVFLIGVPLGSVSGGDKEGKIAVSKGKLQSLDNVYKSKGC